MECNRYCAANECGRRLPSADKDGHSLCDLCRPKHCSADDRCDTCASWSPARFNIFLKCRNKRQRDREYRLRRSQSAGGTPSSVSGISPSPSPARSQDSVQGVLVRGVEVAEVHHIEVSDPPAPSEPTTSVNVPPKDSHSSQATQGLFYASVGKMASILESFEARLGKFEAAHITEQLDELNARVSRWSERVEVPATAGSCPPTTPDKQPVSTGHPTAARSPRALVRRLKRRASSPDSEIPAKVRANLPRQTHRDSDEEVGSKSSGASRHGFLGFSPVTSRQEISDDARSDRQGSAGDSRCILSARRRSSPDLVQERSTRGSRSASPKPSMHRALEAQSLYARFEAALSGETAVRQKSPGGL